MLKYQVTVWWSERDQAFLAMAPQLPGCIAHGETREAALASLDELIEAWLEIADEENWQIPEPPGTMIPVQNELDWCSASKTLTPTILTLQSPDGTKIVTARAPESLRVPRPKSKKLPRGKTRKTHVETTHAV